MMAASARCRRWLDRHPFLVRDFRRMRRKGRLYRTVFIPPVLTAVLLAAVHFGAARIGRPTLLPVVDYALLALTFLIVTVGVLTAGDPLGGWSHEEEASRLESLRLMPLKPGELAAAATERRFYLRLSMALAFLPVILWAGTIARLSSLTIIGVYALIGLTAWSQAPAGRLEITSAGATKTGAGNPQKPVLQAGGWSSAFMMIIYVPVISFLFFTHLSRGRRLDFLTPTLGRDVTPHMVMFPLTLPVMASRYIMHARPFFDVTILPLIWVVAIALLSREIRILSATRLIRSERIPCTPAHGQSVNVLAPPTDRQREDGPLRKLQIARGLILRVALIGAAWPLIETLGPGGLDRLVITLVGFGALVGLLQSISGSRSLFLPGRLESFFQRELPEAVRLGRVKNPSPIAAAMVAAAIGWELLALGLVCLLGGVFPHLSGVETANILALIGAAFLVAEANAIASTLYALPTMSRKLRGTPLWNSGGGIAGAQSHGFVLGFLIAFMVVFGLIYAWMAAPQWVSACAISPFAAWLMLIVEPARTGVAVMILAPGLLAGAAAAAMLASDRRSVAMKATSRKEPANPAKKAPMPLPRWIHRSLAFVVERRSNPFLNLEFNRLQRKGAEVRAQMVMVAMLAIYTAIVLGPMTGSSSGTRHHASFLIFVHASFVEKIHGFFNLRRLAISLFATGMTILFFVPSLILGLTAAAFQRDWKAIRSSGELGFLLMTPLTCRELLVGMVAGKMLRRATIGIVGLPAAAICLAAAVALGIPARMLLLPPVAILLGFLLGCYIVGASMAIAGPERWRPWVVGVFSGSPLLLIIGAIVGLAGAHLGSVWAKAALISLVGATIMVVGAYGWFRFGICGIRRFRETDAAGRCVAS